MRLEILGLRVGSPLGAGCPSYAVSGDGGTLLLDCGPGALDALWRSGLIGRLDGIVVSHMHQDHMLDLVPFSNGVTREALRERFGEQRRTPLHVPRETGRRVLAEVISALGSDPGGVDESFEVHEYDGHGPVRVSGFDVTFAPTQHTAPCYAMRVTDGTATLVYGADGAYTDTLVRHASGADLALLEATYLDDGPELAEQGHMTGEQAAEVARQAGARRLVLTLVMPFEEENAENLRRARARFDGPVDLAAPGAVFEF
jgi:ribonuclease BN (tRNA processing enzyme)